MYIKSVVIDGFKSYGRRTEIHGFDREFTAITGLNGTGKSNILDSICFVLGISNLGQVRAANMTELVYKSGQAGVTKATVTLIFDNTNEAQCPFGYEKCREISVTRQVVVGGKNKYLINGKLVQNKKVCDFFCSVQLNVNNPNFLIMQGRITKVLNMKPHEILSMIEEAAGTSLYETKREATTKLMEKKEGKVRETHTVLDEDVQPKLEKLMQEREAYLEYQQLGRDLDLLTSVHISYQYITVEKHLANSEKKIEDVTNHIELCTTTTANNDDECKRIDETLKEVQKQIDEASGGILKEYADELAKKETESATYSGKCKAAQSQIEHERKELKSIEKNIKDDQKALDQKETQMTKAEADFGSLREADEKDAKAYEDATSRYDAVTRGLSANEDGEAASLQDQLTAAQKELSEAKTVIKTSQMELSHSSKVLKKKENESQTNDAAYIKDKALHDKLEADIQKLEAQLAATNYEEGAVEKLQETRVSLNQEIRQLKQQLDRLKPYRFEMNYQDPEPNFDRSKVHGMVGKLFEVPDKNNCLALMMTAGGSIYSYVTEDDETSKKILQRGQLQHRVTIIPMNKVTPHSIQPHVVRAAQNLAGAENVQAAISLIDYDPQHEVVMRYVFGHTLICRDLDTAKKVTYNRSIHCRSVTLDGDVVDPEGTLSGGSRPKGANVLEELSEIRRLENQIASLKQELVVVEQNLRNVGGAARAYNAIKENLDGHRNNLKACKQRLALTSFHQQQEEIALLKARMEQLQEEIQQAAEKEVRLQAKTKDIQAKLVDAKGYRERELKAASEAMKAAKKKADASRNNWNKHEKEFETLRMEIEEIKKGINKAKEKGENQLSKITQLEADIEKLREESGGVTQEVDRLQSLIKEEKEKINSRNKELKNLSNQKQKLQKKNQQLSVEIKEKNVELKKLHSEKQALAEKITYLEGKYTWILTEKHCFGLKNTRYDYEKEDPIKAAKKIEVLQTKKDQMERHINLRSMSVLDRELETYEQTVRRSKIVETDKEKLLNIIIKMDEQKRERVQKAWQVVDENFSSIFSTLLPGAQARLSPVNTGRLLTGLEIKVGFNNVWKESLGELSGGQRSLVALSLVLAMLKFSPAPLYILDEVDAALDMSHTQNIGNMLKTHFTDSQFIIVSLKDGMFNNANVLFRTKFEDGVSAVTRTVNPNAHKK